MRFQFGTREFFEEGMNYAWSHGRCSTTPAMVTVFFVRFSCQLWGVYPPSRRDFSLFSASSCCDVMGSTIWNTRGNRFVPYAIDDGTAGGSRLSLPHRLLRASPAQCVRCSLCSVRVYTRGFLTFRCRQRGATVGNARADFQDEKWRNVVEDLLIPHEDIHAEIMSSRKGPTSPDDDGWQEVKKQPGLVFSW